MNTTSTPQIWEINLLENWDKETEKQPDFAAEQVSIGGAVYEAAAWLSQIKNGANAGRPYISLQLSSISNNAAAKIYVSLWEKRNRKNSADPHFRAKETLNSRQTVFNGWIEREDQLYRLRITVAPVAFGPGSGVVLSEEAEALHKQLQAFVRTTDRQLPGGKGFPQPAIDLGDLGAKSGSGIEVESSPVAAATVRDTDIDPDDDVPY